jgi:hypothetical protein
VRSAAQMMPGPVRGEEEVIMATEIGGGWVVCGREVLGSTVKMDVKALYAHCSIKLTETTPEARQNSA